MNTYYIFPSDSPLIPEILLCSVQESTDAMRKSNDGSKLVFKLPAGDAIPEFLQSSQPYTHDEILQELTKPDWVSLL